ncbi:ATP-binding cassette domain-containing protein [Paenibacillus sp. MMS18-CY102]|uniref:ATP-binding cassette domain-containing protein n=1 Tax=Paenibacillus sp. MMS18-CY102 TaxID=2682849 RepID=UPI0013662A75|nr:ATP-binding cassette domain-containing protein [Paenibacillus sp. MMS18-CY102]MWC29026.1 ATP-binding cassette domain-containing protein [Paenibacillus sp. MMS18-CY102]
MLLDLHHVDWRRGGKSPFRLNIPRLTFRPGITLLVGRNGAGKTSLLQLLATAELPLSGTISYDGWTTSRHLPEIRSQIGFVPTGVELYEQLTASKLLRYMEQLKGFSGSVEASRVLEAFQLEPYRSRKIKTLAHGIRQRIALAQAWIGNPSYMMLDEPLNAMDAIERLRFIRYLAAYARDRVVIVSTHELNEWEGWAQRIVWMDEGRPKFDSSAADWLASLPLRVWEGPADADTYRKMAPTSIIDVKPSIDDGFIVRFMAAEPPSPCFEEQQPTLEDAYFIRRRSS